MMKKGLMKRIMMTGAVVLCLGILLSACGIAKKPADSPNNGAVIEEQNGSNNEKEARRFMEKIIGILNEGDIDAYYDYYSIDVIELSGDDIKNVKSKARMGYNNSAPHDYRIVEESYNATEDYYEYLIGFYSLYENRDTYLETAMCVFEIAGEFTHCEKEIYDAYAEEIRARRGISGGSGQGDAETITPAEPNTPAETAAAARTFSGSATLASGHATIELTSNPGDKSITLKITNNCGSTLAFYQQEQNIITTGGKSEAINFFDNTDSGMIQVPAGSWGEVSYNLSDDQYNNMTGLKGMIYIQGFEAFDDNTYDLIVADIQ